MRIQLVSDLHCEFLARRWPSECLVTPAPDADVLVLAGDIAVGAAAVKLFKDWPVPVIYCLGNHEFYTGRWPDVLDDVRRAAAGSNLHLLERQALQLDGVRFLGATLWTDYMLAGPNAQSFMMREAKSSLSDHKLISVQGGHLFRPSDALSDHVVSRAWLEEQLAQPFAGKTVVVTHHAPHPGSIHEIFRASNLNASFVSDLTPLVEQPDLWLHGHVHNGFHYMVGSCRVVANPRGYPINISSASTLQEVRFENPDFNPHCTLVV